MRRAAPPSTPAQARLVSQYGVDWLHESNADPKVTVRAVYIIDPNKKIRATFTYPPSAGRNFNEILRLIDSLQLTDGYKVATPVNWEDGQDVIVVPSISDDEADKLFPKGYNKIKPYLRTTPQPNK